jgi:peptidoglycan/xylan/chitin deacetylase (PgdA/CDA1 family)
MSARLAIFSYHKIGVPTSDAYPTWNYVPEETFVAHLSHLRDNDWTVLDLETALIGLERPETLPPRAALLTFDDGYRTMLTVAAPLLQRFGYPGVVFVPTEYIGDRNSWDEWIEPDEPICSWEELCALEQAGVAVQAHSVTHRAFSDITIHEIREEITVSKQVLEQGLERSVELFAYPYGDFGAEREIVDNALRAAGYRAACRYGGSVSIPGQDDHFRLPRLAMGPDSNLAEILS